MVEVTDYTESYNLDKQSPSVFQFFTLPTDPITIQYLREKQNLQKYMVKDMMDAWMPQQRDLGPRNGNWSLTRKTNFSPKLAKFFFFFQKTT